MATLRISILRLSAISAFFIKQISEQKLKQNIILRKIKFYKPKIK